MARADVVLWIDDTSNNIGTFDITTGKGAFIGNANIGRDQTLTDIGFTSSGALYGVSYDNTYLINQGTGAGSFKANNPSGGMNALVGAGANTLYGASNDTTKLYSFNTTTNTWSTMSGGTGGDSAGDLAAANGVFYESEQDGGVDKLVKLSISGGSVTGTEIHDFSYNGHSFGLDDVFGLADNGTTMYAVDGTTIYSVDLTDGDLTYVANYAGDVCTGRGDDKTCLGNANGTAFMSEAAGGVPEPATWAMLILGMGLIGSQLRARRAMSAAVA